MSKTRGDKPKKLLRAVEKLRLKYGDRRVGKRTTKGQPAQDSFANFYLD
jgi:hypothetical protein